MENTLVNRVYTREGQNPKDLFQWEKRHVRIQDSAGKYIFDARDLEFPTGWSSLASKVVGSKYFYRGNGKTHKEKSVADLLSRVDGDLAASMAKQGIITNEEAPIFRDEMFYLGASQSHAFNSPVWFNSGLHTAYGVTDRPENSSHYAYVNGEFTNKIDAYEYPQASACFIQSIQDNMGSILGHASKEGMLFKFGSGTGTNFSVLRGINEPLSGGGVASGSISFMRIYDIIAGRIQSGGKTRRAAKMVSLNTDHPDIYRFIYWKVNEEKKALWLSSNPLWAPRNSADLESEAYKTVDGQNGNNSVRLSDDFMNAAINGKPWDLYFRTKDKFATEEEIPMSEYKDDRYLPDKRFVKKVTNKRKGVEAGELLEHIARAAAAVGDPAVQYDDNINKWNTCKESGRINASNPCSEFMFLDDSACNLASIRLTKFSNVDKILDVEKFKRVVSYSIMAQESLVDSSSYPSKPITENSHRFRPLGLGYTDLGALLMEKGVAYDSKEGRAIASAVTSLMTAQAYKTSIEMAKKLGAFEEFGKNKESMLEVIGMHKDAHKKINKIKDVSGLEELLHEGTKIWEEVAKEGQQYGFRNSQVTLLAPTGTIGFMMDVDCTGVEPMPALQSTKGLAGGGQLEIGLKACVLRGLKTLGYNDDKLEKIVEYIAKEGTVVGAPGLKENHYNVFATALERTTNAISVDGHLNMMAAVQPFLSGAISKTVNLPKGSSIEDVKNTYIKGWQLGLKSVSLYVDGSKGIQPINIQTKVDKNGGLKWGDRDKPKNSMVPGLSMDSGMWNVKIGKTGVFIAIQEYDNRPPKSSPAAVFVEFGSAGSPYAAAYTSWGKESSRNIQRGEDVKEFIEHNRAANGSINGMTNHPLIKTVSSIEDLVAKIIALEYLGDTSICDVKPTPEQIRELRCNILAKRRRDRHFQSRIDFIDNIMEKGNVGEIFPLYEDEISKDELSVGETYCTNCGSITVLSGANCRKCPNCGDAGGCG